MHTQPLLLLPTACGWFDSPCFCFSLVVGRWEVENVRIEHILSRTESEMLGRSTRNENSSGSRGSTPRINRNFVQPLVCFYRLRRNIQQKYSKGMAIPCVCVWCSGLVVHIQKNAHLSFLFCIVQHRWFAVGAIFVRGNESWIWQSFRVVHCQNGKIRQALPSYKCRSNSKQRHVGGLPRTSNFLKGQPYFFLPGLAVPSATRLTGFLISQILSTHLCTIATGPSRTGRQRNTWQAGRQNHALRVPQHDNGLGDRNARWVVVVVVVVVVSLCRCLKMLPTYWTLIYFCVLTGFDWRIHKKNGGIDHKRLGQGESGDVVVVLVVLVVLLLQC